MRKKITNKKNYYPCLTATKTIVQHNKMKIKNCQKFFFDQSCASDTYMQLFPILFMKQQIVSSFLRAAEVS